MTRRFRTSFEYSPLVAALDLLLIHCCAWAAIVFRSGSASAADLHIYAHILPLLSVAAVVSFSVCGLYRIWPRRPRANLISSVLVAEFLYVTAWMSMSGWEPRWAISRGAIAASAALQFIALVAERILLRTLVRNHEQMESGLIVAEDLASANLIRSKLSGASPWWIAIGECLTAETFLKLSDEEICWGTILLAQNVRDKMPIIRRASELLKNVILIPGVFELWMVGAQAAEIDDVLVLRLTPPHLRPGQRSIKRLLDVAGSMCLLILTSPVMIAAAILVRLTSAGPALLAQTRVGADGKEYTLYKFRTMVVNAEQKTGPVLASSHDPRITPPGRFLRAAHIDELPQLFNVLIGDMSLIGPRPERPHFVKIFRDQFPGYELRLALKPGITGLAQIYGRYSTAPELKLRFDLMYIYNYSLVMDIQILFRTIFAVLQPSHAEVSKEGHASPAVADED